MGSLRATGKLMRFLVIKRAESYEHPTLHVQISKPSLGAGRKGPKSKHNQPAASQEQDDGQLHIEVAATISVAGVLCDQ